MQLREASFPDDLEALRSMMRRYLREYDAEAPPDEYWDDAYYEACASGAVSGSVIVVMMELNDVAIGFCIARLEPLWHRKNMILGYIEEFYVDAGYRRRGYARTMFQYVKMGLAASGAETISASVLRDNARALHFWEAVGCENLTYHLIASARIL